MPSSFLMASIPVGEVMLISDTLAPIKSIPAKSILFFDRNFPTLESTATSFFDKGLEAAVPPCARLEMKSHALGMRMKWPTTFPFSKNTRLSPSSTSGI